jgi:cell division septum initiation protein DivIVA
MAQLNFLDRFRPVGAPGPAGAVGVPASDATGPAVELAPVFAALAADIEAGRELVEDATSRAEAMLATAREQAGALVAQAQLDVAGVRASAAARVFEDASGRDAALLTQAEHDSDTLRQAGTAQLPSTVRTVIDRMLSEYLGQK